MSDDLIIDLSNYKDRVGSRVAPGRYRVQVEDAELTESAAKNPMVNLWFRIAGGEFDGQTVTDRLVLTEKSLFRVVGFMQAIYLPTPKKRLKLNLRQFVGKTLEIDVEDGEPYNGRVRSEVRGYVRVARAETAELEDELASITSSDATDLPEPEEVTASPKQEAPAPTRAAESVDDDESVDLETVEL